jgi:hypothetical protein
LNPGFDEAQRRWAITLSEIGPQARAVGRTNPSGPTTFNSHR